MQPIIGIDLGTTNSSVGVVLHDEPRTVVNAVGNRTTPSVVSLGGDGEVLVGQSARNQAVSRPEMTVQNVKRLIGTAEYCSLGDQRYAPEEISALILEQLRSDAEAYLGTSVKECVITVPAHFSQAQRLATREAGRLAGLEVRRIINEPTAAALAYASELARQARIVVYDLGGGTFDVTCLERDGEKFAVRSTLGDGALGGVEFDRMLLEHVVKEFEQQAGTRLQEDRVVMQQLQELVERAKIELSSRVSSTVALPFFGRTGGTHLTCELTRELFEELITPMLHRSVGLTELAVAEAGFNDEHGIDYLVLAGGSTRIPLVQRYLERKLGCRPSARINPDEVVALGAALDAELVRSASERRRVQDVTGFALGVETDGDTSTILIPRNTALPARVTEVFTTVSDRQHSAQIHVLQGEERIASRNASLGRFMLAGLSEGARGEPRIEVGFELDHDGIVTVRARDLASGVEEQTTVVPMFEEASPEGRGGSTPREDELRAAQRQVQRLVSYLEGQLSKHAGALDAEFRTEIEELLQAAQHAARTLRRPARLHEYRIALETIVQELRAVDLESEVGNEGA